MADSKPANCVLLARFKLFQKGPASEAPDGIPRLKLTEQGKKNLRKIDSGMINSVVLCVVGDSRTGKSTILTMLMDKLVGKPGSYADSKREDAPFPSRSGHESFTEGVDAAMLRITVDGEPCNVLLLDAEGEGDGDERARLSGRILSTAACGLTDIVVMNHEKMLHDRDRATKMDPIAKAARALRRRRRDDTQRCVVLIRNHEEAYPTMAAAEERVFAKGSELATFPHKTCVLVAHPRMTAEAPSVALDDAAATLVELVTEQARDARQLNIATAVTDLASVITSEEFLRAGADLDTGGRLMRAKELESSIDFCAISGRKAWFDPIEATVLFDHVHPDMQEKMRTHTREIGDTRVVNTIVEREELVARLEALGGPHPDVATSLEETRARSLVGTVSQNRISEFRDVLHSAGPTSSVWDGVYFSRRAHAALLAAVKAGAATVEGESEWTRDGSFTQIAGTSASVAELMRRDRRFAVAAAPDLCPPSWPFACRGPSEEGAAAASASSAAVRPVTVGATRPMLLDCVVSTMKPSVIVFGLAKIRESWGAVGADEACKTVWTDDIPFGTWASTDDEAAGGHKIQAQLYVAAARALNLSSEGPPPDWAAAAGASAADSGLLDGLRPAEAIVNLQPPAEEHQVGGLVELTRVLQALTMAGLHHRSSAPPLSGDGWDLAEAALTAADRAALPLLAAVTHGISGVAAVATVLRSNPLNATFPLAVKLEERRGEAAAAAAAGAEGNAHGRRRTPTGFACAELADRDAVVSGVRSNVLGAGSGLAAALAAVGDCVMDLCWEAALLGWDGFTGTRGDSARDGPADEDPAEGANLGPSPSAGADPVGGAGAAATAAAPKPAGPSGSARKAVPTKVPPVPKSASSGAGGGPTPQDRSDAAEHFCTRAARIADMAGVFPATVAAVHGHDKAASDLLGCLQDADVRAMCGWAWADVEPTSPWAALRMDAEGIRALWASRRVLDWTAPPPEGSPEAAGPFKNVLLRMVADCASGDGDLRHAAAERLRALLRLLPSHVVNIPGDSQLTPLSLAIRSRQNRATIMHDLLEAGAALPSEHAKALAARGADEDVAILVADAKVAVEPRSDGDAALVTPLHSAASMGDAMIARSLCDAGLWTAGEYDRTNRLPVQCWDADTDADDDGSESHPAPECLDPVAGLCAFADFFAQLPSKKFEGDLRAMRARKESATPAPSKLMDAAAGWRIAERWAGQAGSKGTLVRALVPHNGSAEAATRAMSVTSALERAAHGALLLDPTHPFGLGSAASGGVGCRAQAGWVVAAAAFSDAWSCFRAFKGQGSPENGAVLALPNSDGMCEAAEVWASIRPQEAARVGDLRVAFEPSAKLLGGTRGLRRLTVPRCELTEELRAALCGLEHLLEVRCPEESVAALRGVLAARGVSVVRDDGAERTWA